jgi:hypothetical protein
LIPSKTLHHHKRSPLMMNIGSELVRFELGLSPIQAALVLERVLAQGQPASTVLQHLVDRGLEIEDTAGV